MGLHHSHSFRITAGFTVVLVMLITIALIGNNAIDSGRNSLDMVVNTDTRKIRDAGQAVQNLIALQRAEKNMILSTTQLEMDEYERKIERLDDELAKIVSALASRVDANGAALLTQFEREYANFRETQKQVIALTRQNANVLARELSQGEARIAHNEAMQFLSKLVELNQRAFNAQVELLRTDKSDNREAVALRLERTLEKIKIATAISDSLAAMQRDEKNLVLARNQIEIDEYGHTLSAIRSNLDSQTAELNALISSSLRDAKLTSAQRQNLEAEQIAVANFITAYRNYRSYHERVISLSRQNSNKRALELSTNTGRQGFDQAEQTLEALVHKIDQDMVASISRADAGYTQYQRWTLLITLLAVFSAILTGLLVVRGLKRRTQRITERAVQLAEGALDTDSRSEQVSDELQQIEHALDSIQEAFREIMLISEQLSIGNLDHRLKPRSTNDQLVEAINRMADSSSAVVNVASRVADGDLNTTLTLRSERDQLGKAIQSMISSLQYSEKENQNRLWLDEGVARINTTVLGEKSVAELAANVIEALCRQVNAQIGALYISEGAHYEDATEAETELVLIGSYAYTDRKKLSNRYRLGESLVGQAALEKKAIVVSQLPEDYIHIGSGIGSSAPAHLLVVPFLYDGRVLGVIELGTLDAFTPLVHSMLARATDAIAIAFNSAAARMALAQALKDSQALTEELRVQQESLASTNAELEEQTQALEVSQQEVEARNQKLMLAQDELNERAEQLRQSNKYKSEFLANMSHELRTPLNSILLLSKILASGDIEDMSEQRSNAQVIYDAGNDLLNLINEVLDLAKIESGKMLVHFADIETESFLKSYRPLFTPQAAEKNLEFEIEVAADAPKHFISDSERIQQVLRNFLSNAFKFTAAGRVTLQASPVSNDIIDGLVTFGTIRTELQRDPAAFIAFNVIDTGVGIAEDKRQLVFEAFQQLDGSTSRQYGGTGLGLSISSQLAEMLGGAVGLRSDLGKGAIFTLVLPLNPPASLYTNANDTGGYVAPVEPSQNPSQSISASSFGGVVHDDQLTTSPNDERILLVIEDDARFAKTLIKLGHKHDFKVIYASTGTEGVRLAEFYTPAAILLDIQLPILDGWGVLRHLKKNPKTSHIPVHIVSVVDDVQFGYRLGAAHYLQKPVDPEQLEEAFDKIESLLERKVRHLLVVEDNNIERDSIIKLLQSDGAVECTGVGSGAEALDTLRTEHFDTVILDLRLSDMTGNELLRLMAEDSQIEQTPVIVYTGKDLSIEEEKQLREFAQSIVLKTAESPARLLEETSIFLHQVRSSLSEEKQKMIAEVCNVDAILKGRTVLLVDDDIRNTFALSAVLENRGLNVLTASNGEEALLTLEENAQKIELVLMDVMMPVMDGYEAMRRIRAQEEHKNLPVIALTAKALREDRELCIAAGASDYMAKPIDYDQLFSLIRVWMSAKS